MEKSLESRLALLQFLFLLFFGVVMGIMVGAPFLLVSSVSMIALGLDKHTEKKMRRLSFIAGSWFLVLFLLCSLSLLASIRDGGFYGGPRSIGAWLHLW